MGTSPLQSLDDILTPLTQVADEVPWAKRLLAQVIRRAAVDFALYYTHDIQKMNKLGEAAHAWLFLDGSEFTELCTSLGVDYRVVRQYVVSLSEEDARSLRGLDFSDSTEA